MNRKLSILILAGLATLFGLGCSLDDGLKAGLTNGVSSALSSAITTPISIILERTFGTAD